MPRLEPWDRLRELPYRLRQRSACRELTWPLAQSERERLSIVWPTRYDWPHAAHMVETFRDALQRLIPMRFEATPQPYRHVVMLRCALNGDEFTVGLDYADRPDIHPNALAQCSLYFKLQYERCGYGAERVVPGGYPVSGLDFYRYMQPYRRRRRSLDVLARFGYGFQAELRRFAATRVERMRGIRAATSGRVRYSRFVREAASARLALELPGNGFFTYRVAEYLGVGTCMLALPQANALPVTLRPGVHFVEIAPDLSDLVDRIQYYLKHEEERERIAAAGREFFDRYLHCDQLAAYYVRTVLDRMGSTPRADTALAVAPGQPATARAAQQFCPVGASP